jgi:hypothetical protein
MDVGHREHSLDLCDRENVTRETAPKSGEFDLGRRIRQENVRPREPLEESFDGDQAAVLRPERDRFPARQAPMKEVPLVRFDDGLRHLRRLRDRSRSTPFDELAKPVAAGLDGL